MDSKKYRRNFDKDLKHLISLRSRPFNPRSKMAKNYIFSKHTIVLLSSPIYRLNLGSAISNLFSFSLS